MKVRRAHKDMMVPTSKVMGNIEDGIKTTSDRKKKVG
jgi:hypothetical protein